MGLILRKLVVFITGLFVMALGVALSVKANLGVSPISCVPYVFSVKSSLTLGQLTVLFNAALMGLQMILLRRNYRLVQLVQLPLVFLFGFFIDLSLHLVANLHVAAYGGQVGLCVLSSLVLALGVFLEVTPDLTYLPGEGLIVVVADRFKLEFGKVKIAVDSAMVLGGVLSSVVLIHGIEGVREGTLFAALFVGAFVRLYRRMLPQVKRWLVADSAKKVELEQLADPGRLVVSLSRECGSGDS